MSASAPVQLPLFPPEAVPETAVPVGEASLEWQAAQMLRLFESIRYNPERLARYCGQEPSRRDFLDWSIAMLGGRSQ